LFKASSTGLKREKKEHIHRVQSYLNKMRFANLLFNFALASELALPVSAHEGHEEQHNTPVKAQDLDPTKSFSQIDWETVVPKAHVGHVHGMPIMNKTLTPEEYKYWSQYNTTTYFTVDAPSKFQLWIHIVLFIGSFVFVYPFVMILNNLDSNWYLPALTVHAAITIASTIAYSIFISGAPDLFPNMAYSKMVTGLFVLTIIHYVAAIIYTAKRWLEGGPRNPAASHYVSIIQRPQPYQGLGDEEYSEFTRKPIPLAKLNLNGHDKLHSTLNSTGTEQSPSSTLYDHEDDLESLNSVQNANTVGSSLADEDNNEPLIFGANSISTRTGISSRRDTVLGRLFHHPAIEKSVNMFGFISIIIFKILNFGMLFYFLVMLPTGIAGLNLLGKGKRVFNLLAHFIKGGVFFTLGLFSLGRYLGAFSRMGGAWNYSFVTKDEKRHSLWLRVQPKGSMITFEMIESSLILLYGTTNIFLEHLAAAGEAWAAKDLQHVSIAFMYIGAGLCGVITEIQLNKWRRSKFYDQVGDLVDGQDVENVTPGFSPNPFPVFTIFWTGLLMSQHAQASELSTNVHVQWGSLLTYGSFFRAFTFLLMSYYPLKDRYACFRPGKPLTELVTSFCLLCGGLVFMESTDQVIEAMEYRGLTPMFTLNMSVGCTALLMAWIMVLFSFKDMLKKKMYGKD